MPIQKEKNTSLFDLWFSRWWGPKIPVETEDLFSYIDLKEAVIVCTKDALDQLTKLQEDYKLLKAALSKKEKIIAKAVEFLKPHEDCQNNHCCSDLEIALLILEGNYEQ
jgi:hypothetical protein